VKPIATPSQTIDVTLDEVLARLARNEIVEGILLLGSTGTSAFTPTSDFDLLLVLLDLPAPVRIVNTWIDHRFAEIYCTTSAALDRILAADAAWLEGTEEAVVLGWLHEGRIVFDRKGRIEQAVARARNLSPAPNSDDADIVEAWRKIGYNVAQIRRYLAAGDPASRMAVNLRLLYSVDEVKFHYFTIRGISWTGEKPAIQYWTENDAVFLEQLAQFFDEPDLHRRVELYVSLAQHCVAPLAPLWDVGDTAISLGAGYGGAGGGHVEGTAQDARDFWHALTGQRTAPSRRTTVVVSPSGSWKGNLNLANDPWFT